MTITEFEQRVLQQKPTSAGHYDAEYFTGDWRDEGNNYNLETRRQIEAKNPALINEVFQPKKALDLGCGPGALMHLLWELVFRAGGTTAVPIRLAISAERLRRIGWQGYPYQ